MGYQHKMLLGLAISAMIAVSACVEEPQYEGGVVLPGPDAKSWGMADSAILSTGTTLNDDETTTVDIQFLSAAVSDDEVAAAPDLICEGLRPTVLSREVRSPTASEKLADGTLIMIVTCGA